MWAWFQKFRVRFARVYKSWISPLRVQTSYVLLAVASSEAVLQDLKLSRLA